MKWAGRNHTPIIEMVDTHLILSIEQRELKRVSSFEKNLNVFRKEEYYTSLFFFCSPEWKKSMYATKGLGGKVPIKQTSIICETVPSGMDCQFLFGSDVMFQIARVRLYSWVIDGYIV